MVGQVPSNISGANEGCSFLRHLADFLDFLLWEELHQVLDWILFSHWVNECLGSHFVGQVSKKSIHVNKRLKLSEHILELIRIRKFALSILDVESGESQNLVNVEAVIQIEIDCRSKSWNFPVRNVHLVSLYVGSKVSKSIKVILRQRLLKEMSKVWHFCWRVWLNDLAINNLLQVNCGLIEILILDVFRE